jgi:N-carbamoyl-L-amino-acid hydrolase
MADQENELRQRKDATASLCPTRSRVSTVDLDTALEARSELENAAAYLELHIEQGPVLEALDLPLGVVLGTFGVERHQVTFRGQAAHAGRPRWTSVGDALAGAARLELEIREIAKRIGEGAVCTMGGVVTKPGIVTSVVETPSACSTSASRRRRSWPRCEQRGGSSRRFAEEENIEVEVGAESGTSSRSSSTSG